VLSVRAIVAIPAIDRMGLLGLSTVVWSVIAVACFLPSFVIAWQGFRDHGVRAYVIRIFHPDWRKSRGSREPESPPPPLARGGFNLW